MKTIELVLKGFDGGTDKTDDKIIWAKIPDNLILELNTKNESNPIHYVSDVNVKQMHKDAVDLTIRPKTKEESNSFINYYFCPDCDHLWQDEWDCTCDDKCPKCNKAYTPYKSIDVNKDFESICFDCGCENPIALIDKGVKLCAKCRANELIERWENDIDNLDDNLNEDMFNLINLIGKEQLNARNQ